MKAYIYLVLSLICLGSCGYSFHQNPRPGGLQSTLIHVSVKDNVSTIPELSWHLLDELRTSLMRSYGFGIGEKNQCDYELNVEVIKIGRDSTGYVNRSVTVDQKEYPYPVLASAYLRVILSVKLVNPKTQEVIWSEPHFEERELYRITEDPMRNNYNVKQAISRISDRLVALVYSAGLTRF